MVLAMQNIVARESDPFQTVVVSIGTIEGGYRNNIIADRVKMSGTFRSQDPLVRESLEGRARRILEGVAAAYGTKVDLKVIYGYPPVCNDAGVVETFWKYLERTHPRLKLESPPATMGGEDFAYFAQRAPGVLVRLGIRNEAQGSVHPGHSPLFRVDEGAIVYGIETLVAFARGVGSGTVKGGSP
jgi:amidohydrolase